MPLSLTILGVFGGFVAFGFLGLFIGPTLIAVGFTLLEAWRGAPGATLAVKPDAWYPAPGSVWGGEHFITKLLKRSSLREVRSQTRQFAVKVYRDEIG